MEDKIPMSASNMFSLKLHRTIFLFTLITGAVLTMPNTYWSKRSGELGQTKIEDIPNPSVHLEENKRHYKNDRGFPLFPFSTIVANKVLIKNEINVKTPNLKTYLDYKLLLRYL